MAIVDPTHRHICTPDCEIPCPIHRQEVSRQAKGWRYVKETIDQVALWCCGLPMSPEGKIVSPIAGTVGETRRCPNCDRPIIIQFEPGGAP